MMRPGTVLLTVVVLVSAGCLGQRQIVEDDITPVRIQQAYPDASTRLSNVVEDVEATTKLFKVECGTARLTAQGIYDIKGDANFTLLRPSGGGNYPTVKSTQLGSGRFLGEEIWYEEANPGNGTWRPDVAVAGGARYAFGVYQEVPPRGGTVSADEISEAFKDSKARLARDDRCGAEGQVEFQGAAGIPQLTVRMTYFVEKLGEVSVEVPGPASTDQGLSCWVSTGRPCGIVK